MNEMITFISDYLGVDKSELNENTDLQNDLGLSSFDVMDLSCELEEEFNIKIDTEKLAELHNIGSMAKLLQN